MFMLGLVLGAVAGYIGATKQDQIKQYLDDKVAKWRKY